MGLLNAPFEDFRVTTHIVPSVPGWTLVIAMGQCRGAVSSFSSMTSADCGLLGDDLGQH